MPYLEQADLLAARVEVRNRLLDDGAATAHGNDDALGLGVAGVLKQLVGPPRHRRHLVHGLLHELRHGLQFTGSTVMQLMQRMQDAAVQGLDLLTLMPGCCCRPWLLLPALVQQRSRRSAATWYGWCWWWWCWAPLISQQAQLSLTR